MDLDSDAEDLPPPLLPRTPCHLQLLRESGALRWVPAVARAVTSSPAFIQRLTLERKLTGHDGCVNTCAFTPDGDFLLSGSDDRLIKLWDWRTGKELLSWNSGHLSNVFQARALPEKSNIVVSCAADGQVRAATLRWDGARAASLCLGGHTGRAHKLALCPERPFTLLSCGEDGSVTHYDLRNHRPAQRLMNLEVPGAGGAYWIRKPLYSVSVNFLRPNEFCLGGGDAAVRIFDLRRPADAATAASGGGPRAAPLCFLSKWRPGTGQAAGAHVTAAVYSCRGELLASYAPGCIHLFSAAAAAGLAPVESESASNGDTAGDEDVAVGRGGRWAARRGSSRGDGRGRGRTSARRGAARRQRHAVLIDDSDEEERRGARQQVRRAPAAPRRAAPRPDSYAYIFTTDDVALPPTEDVVDEPVGAAVADGAPDSQHDRPNVPFLVQLETLDRVVDHFQGPRGMNIVNALLRFGREEDSSSSDGEMRAFEINSDGEIEENEENSEHSIDPEDEEDDQRSDSSEEEESDGGESGEGDSDDESGSGSGSDDEDDSSSNDDSSEEEGDDDEVWAVPRFANWGPGATAPPGLRSRAGPLRGAVLQSYTGHVNDFTIKGVNFFGANDEWVVSGSDDGFIYFWAVGTGKCVACMKGDGHVVNCLERHPLDLSTLATSGIDDDVKIWGATAGEAVGLSPADRRRMAQQAAQFGNG